MPCGHYDAEERPRRISLSVPYTRYTPSIGPHQGLSADRHGSNSRSAESLASPRSCRFIWSLLAHHVPIFLHAFSHAHAHTHGHRGDAFVFGGYRRRHRCDPA